jgi:hypothetical protein
VNVTGTDDQGSPVAQQAFTDIDGNYQVSLPPGDYAVSPVQPGDNSRGRYVPSACSGLIKAPTCVIDLAAGDDATASFKLVRFVVNSTAVDDDPPESLAQDLCDTTPSQPRQTCTLPAAVQLVDKLDGGTILFDIPADGVPRIALQKTDNGLGLGGPSVLDGTSQPGPHRVALMPAHEGTDDRAEGVGLSLGDGVTVLGMVISGSGSTS